MAAAVLVAAVVVVLVLALVLALVISLVVVAVEGIAVPASPADSVTLDRRTTSW